MKTGDQLPARDAEGYLIEPAEWNETVAVRLADELGDLLEQASQALRDGEASRASQRLRDASFALADFRDLFQSRAAAS
jgi:hypothetical protein